ncbi:hypothetical protein EV193_109243 [Herbihabitans rhizosphaerae]|uniref:Uncharacterized protein n=1 Tax=Herbihabitans rhizosphaerae TaxID=1872711 RepID=A0A4Q7KGS7_9PSEU|nr:hypothetical protein [Herbihabitans rhizosphaerae]RZS34452.1 hypothetical protein EV193_109243 [Herbihabitans rhizosphaerae]
MAYDPLQGMSLGLDDKAFLRKTLRELAEDRKHPVGQLARDVLSGKTSLKAALSSPESEAVFREAHREFSEWNRDLSDEERERQLERAKTHLQEIRIEEDAREAGVRLPRPVDDTDDEPPANVLRRGSTTQRGGEQQAQARRSRPAPAAGDEDEDVQRSFVKRGIPGLEGRPKKW